MAASLRTGPAKFRCWLPTWSELVMGRLLLAPPKKTSTTPFASPCLGVGRFRTTRKRSTWKPI